MARRLLIAIGVGVVLAGGIALAVLIDDASRTAASEPLDPHPDSPLQVVALGDSYISGEGAEQYFPGTDETGEERNLCHRAPSAYPYLIADELGASLRFAACSGARIADVTGVDAQGQPAPGQHPRSGEGVYGAHPQVAVLENLASPDLVLLSIGGNDAGFGEIGAACANPVRTCSKPGSSSAWLRRLDEVVYPGLVRTYRTVRRAAGGAPVFALTYPNPFGPEYCDDLIGVNRAEMAFLRDEFSPALNEKVEAAARVARVEVVDLASALDGRRFCERPLRETAIHFVKLGRTTGSRLDLGALARGSLHPNPEGHRMIRDVVLARLAREHITGETLPLSDAAGSAAPTAPR
jgi:lysophospholipase L1-like esterase